MLNTLLKFYVVVGLMSCLFLTKSWGEENQDYEVKFCLSSFYTAQKSFHAENDFYSLSSEEIGFNGENCPNLYFYISASKNTFLVEAFEKESRRIVGYINERKELIIK